MLPRPVQAVIFDMDGLLIDTERVVRDAMLRVASEQGRELPLAVFLRMVGLPEPASRAVAVAHFGEDFAIEAFDEAVEALVEAKLSLGATVKAGVAELLDFLDAARLPRAVATSSSHTTVERHLGRAGILQRFDRVVAAGDYARGKPFPDPYLAAASHLGVKPGVCLALEDSHNGVRAAHAAGMMTIMVPDLLEATDEMRGLCVAVTQTLHEVRSMLEAAAGPATRQPAASRRPSPPTSSRRRRDWRAGRP